MLFALFIDSCQIIAGALFQIMILDLESVSVAQATGTTNCFHTMKLLFSLCYVTIHRIAVTHGYVYGFRGYVYMT